MAGVHRPSGTNDGVSHPAGCSRASNSSCKARRYQRLNCPGRCARSIVTCHDGSETDLLATAVGPFDDKLEDQSRLAGRPGPVAMPVVEHFDAEDVLARRQQGSQVDRIGVEASGIAGGRAPLDPPAVDRQQVSAVGRDKAPGPAWRAAERHLAAKQQERVGQRPLRRQPDPPCRREIDSPRPPGRRTDGRMKHSICFLDRKHAVCAGGC